jgi:type I restriction enzyme S subunit
MSEWKEHKLSELCEITSSKRIFYSDYDKDGIPFWRSKEVIEQFNRKEVSTELYITYKKYEDIMNSHGVPQENDILLTSVGTIGKTYLVKNNDKFYFKDGNLTWFRNHDRAIVEPKFLKLWIDSSIGQEALNSITIGSTQEALTIRSLKDLKISLPPLPEQKAIAGVLSCLDDKIDLLHRQNKTLEAMAETLFRQWFIENTEGEEVAITKLIEFNSKESLPKLAKADYLDMSNIQTDSFNPISWYKRTFASGSKFRNRDTLLARISPCLENGKACYVTFLENNSVGWGSTEFIVMRALKRFHPLVSYALAKNIAFRDFAVSCLEGSSGRQRVNTNHLAKFLVNYPSEEAINTMNELLNSIEPKLISNFQQIRLLESARETLLPKLMSGEVKVELE